MAFMLRWCPALIGVLLVGACGSPAPPLMGPSPNDPFLRVDQSIRLRQAPLYVEQLISEIGRHRYFVGVNRAAFCKLTPEARERAVATVYHPVENILHGEGIYDVVFLFTPTTTGAPKVGDALAVGDRDGVRLTPAGRAC
jgi:hypothetical protein